MVRVVAAMLLLLLGPQVCDGQFGGVGGMPGGGANAPSTDIKPKFREHLFSQDGLPIRRERGDALVADVTIVGNQAISTHAILQKINTRKDRFYDYETVLGDIRRLNDMGSFDHVTFELDERADGIAVKFLVRERPAISRVIFHGNRGMSDRELLGRAGLNPTDPRSEFSIESARRRLVDFYQEEGFNQVSIQTHVGLEDDPGVVIFRINEGPLERIRNIRIQGNTILSQARLKNIIKSRGPMLGVVRYGGNKADLSVVNRDVNVLAAAYHNLGFLTATVGRRFEYDQSGKWMNVTFVINEGPRFRVHDIQIVGNQFVTTDSLRERLELSPGDMFDGTIMRRDVGELIYGYGELGFIYADVEPRTVMRDEANEVDLIYKIIEGDRWKIGEIKVNIEGEPHLMRETTMLNLIDLREGDFIDRRTLELNTMRIERSQLLETNPQVAEPPDIKVVPRDEANDSLGF